MKNKVMYLLPLLLALATSCIRNTGNSPTGPNYSYPLGTFTGTFTRIHKNPVTFKYDTATAALKLVLSTSIGYKVTGDTSTVHAGSYGSFSENSTNIGFNDVTYPAEGNPKKTHLSGAYSYTYDGYHLQLSTFLADTIWYNYTFTKVAN
jgi:hypothetical protein